MTPIAPALSRPALDPSALDSSALDPARLDPTGLDRRLHERIGSERDGQVAFLVDLELFDRREDFLRAGFGSLWDYCRRSLHLREGATHRRITAMRLLRRFPGLAGPLRDGRLCLTTVSVLRDVLSEESFEELVARAAYLSKAETEHLVATLRPRVAPREGIRKLPAPAGRRELALAVAAPEVELLEATQGAMPAAASRAPCAPPPVGATAHVPQPRRPVFEPISADVWSMRVNVDGALKAELETLTALLSHRIPSGDLGSVLREAVACAIDKHGKRRGAVRPARTRVRAEKAAGLAGNAGNTGTGKEAADASGAGAGNESATATGKAGGAATGLEASSSRTTIPVEVRRRVWERDEGRCTFLGPEGQRCGSRHRVELHHVIPAALGGPSTVENLAVHCKSHNRVEAESAYGREHMARFRSRRPA